SCFPHFSFDDARQAESYFKERTTMSFDEARAYGTRIGHAPPGGAGEAIKAWEFLRSKTDLNQERALSYAAQVAEIGPGAAVRFIQAYQRATQGDPFGSMSQEQALSW